jgi:ribulose-phosphate 3-epimerase
MVKITVSILTKNDKETILKLNNTNLDYFHIDVMDGKFVNEINFPISKIEKIKEYVNKPLDIHLMVEKPNDFLINCPFPK